MLAYGVTFFTLLRARSARTGKTGCAATTLDWFTTSVGETPCRMYERLRQSCSPDYEAPFMTLEARPLDTCNDQASACCCNSVAFSLQMMCMNCQYLMGMGPFDALGGDYGIYLNRCGPVTNGSLPSIVQETVCKQGLNIPKYMYGPLISNDGYWLYSDIERDVFMQIAAGNNDTGLCPKTSATASETETGASATSSSGGSSQPSTNVGAIVGGIVGGLVLLALAALAGFFVARRRKQRGIVDLTEETKTPEATFEPFQMPPGGPTHDIAPTPYAAPILSDWASTDASGSAPASIAPPPRSKPGLIATNPPTRAEVYDTETHLSPSGTMPHFSGPERHEDSEALSTAYGLGRSASGRLPPSYQPR